MAPSGSSWGSRSYKDMLKYNNKMMMATEYKMKKLTLKQYIKNLTKKTQKIKDK